MDRDRNRWPEGEIQVFADYQEMLVDARIEREAAARDAHVPLHLLDELICERRDQRTRRRHERRKLLRRAALGVR
jgi:hypothetical protein